MSNSYKCLFLRPLFLGFLLAMGIARTLAAAEVVPDRLLRSWDPVTVFFDNDTGPSTGPLTDPGTYLDAWPEQPGAYEWLDARTLQFRPAVPWTPMSKHRFGVGGKTWTLDTLLEPPVSSAPAMGARDLPALADIRLTFRDAVTPAMLASQLRVGLRPLPGAHNGPVRWIEGDELDIKLVDRHQLSQPVTAVIRLPEIVPEGTDVSLALRLGEPKDAAIWRLRFSTAPAFRVVRFGCAQSRYPVPAEGVVYDVEATLECEGEQRQLAVELSSAPAAFDALQASRLVRLRPPVEDLSVSVADRTLLLSGRFEARRTYQMALHPASILDVSGRPLRAPGPTKAFITFPQKEAFVRLRAGRGIIERFGAQHVPLAGRSEDQLDVRVHRIDPLDRSLWPFPDEPLNVDESQRPPGPGERPAPFADARRPAQPGEIAAQLKSLGSPDFSAIVRSPLRRDGAGARFGFDLAPALAAMKASGRPGTYLVGLRRLGGKPERAWMRVQVTDLALSTVAAGEALRFQVTSLASGAPIAGATVRIEGWRNKAGRARFEALIDGVTDASGGFEWRATNPASGGQVLRIVVRFGDDSLVLDPTRPPDAFSDNRWQQATDTWLQWTRYSAAKLTDPPSRHCHLFSERPVYRPEHAVHLKGWVRVRDRGQFEIVRGDAELVFSGPNELEWRYPVKLSEHGSFYHYFDEPDLPAGSYNARLEYPGWGSCGGVSFKKEDYKLPEFEVRLHGPDIVPLDREFDVSTTAHYYAGGRAADRPLRWRVTQFPASYAPKSQPGYRFSSQSTFSSGTALASENVLEQEVRTDSSGAGQVRINPGLEASAAPRRYVIEATVTGADGRTVTATRQVLGLPAFVLGLKVPRVLQRADEAGAQLLALSPDGTIRAGLDVEVRLLKREWHAHLRAGDFSSGVAKYVTETVDRVVSERRTRTGAEPLSVPLPLNGAGVYVVEVSALDSLGRMQTVRADFFAAGAEPVTWSRPPAKVFKISTDKSRYRPGEAATLVLESPYQSAHALAVVEAPEANRYTWLDVTNGAATFELPILEHYTPKLPVHFLLMRGRVADSPSSGGLDPGRPATLAATRWLDIEAVEHRLEVSLDSVKKARPGEVIDVTVMLRDGRGAPVSGEATLWMVDQAVLALGREQRLDPLRDFLSPRASRVQIHDTRNGLFGYLPFEEYPGGGAGDMEPADLLDNVTVRRRFVPVPYYADAIAVDASGEATVSVQLPDNLTNFRLRAKAVSGAQRFGAGTGQLAVRLPLIVQPKLPRFVRPGDRFDVGASARVVDGPAGAASAQVRVEGISLVPVHRAAAGSEGGSANRSTSVPAPSVLDTHVSGAERERSTALALVPNAPLALRWPAEVPSAATGEVKVSVAVQRDADATADAFAVTLPVRADRRVQVRRMNGELGVGEHFELPALDEAVRSGTLTRTVRLSTEPAVLALVGTAGFMAEYPYGCTEQRIARVRAGLALERFADTLGMRGDVAALTSGLGSTFDWIDAARGENGLVAYWPGSRGYVSLTAWSLQLAVAARRAGHPAPERLEADLVHTLRQALRSDYPLLVDGSEYAERAWALAALTDAGVGDPGYSAELAARAQFFSLENLAQVVRSLARDGRGARTQIDALSQQLFAAVNTRLQDGATRYLGLSDRASVDGVILPSEARTLAEMLRTSVAVSADVPRRILTDALVTLADADGWGDTNANAAALEALADTLDLAGPSQAVLIEAEGGAAQAKTLRLDRDAALTTWSVASGAALRLRQTGASARPVGLLAQASYVPLASGAEAKSLSAGFVVSRTWARVPSQGELLERVPADAPGRVFTIAAGAVVEEIIDVVNPTDRHHVAVVAPLAAGFEPLNPVLATAPPEAQPSAADSAQASYRELRDDRVTWYFDRLPKGTYQFRYRLRAVTRGRYVQPPAYAELMYDQAVTGRSVGAWVAVAPPRATAAPAPDEEPARQ